MTDKLKIIIPVAGIGTRLRPHTYSTPKPLIPVAGKPMLAHVVDPLAALNPEEVVFVVGYLGDQIVDYIYSNYQFKVSFVEQTELLGLGFAVNIALQSIENGPLLVVLGDTIVKTDFSEFISIGDNVIGLKQVDDPRRFGVAIIKDGRITSFIEKPQEPVSDLAIIGLYYFKDSNILRKHVERIISQDKRTKGEIQLTDALDSMVNEGNEFRPYLVDGWYDCGKKETVLKTNRSLLPEFNQSANYPGSEIIPPVYISSSARVEESVIGPYVSISEKAIVRHSTIKNSVIFAGASVESSFLEESLVGENAIIRNMNGRLNIGNFSEVRVFNK